jgi:hypothetical protein
MVLTTLLEVESRTETESLLVLPASAGVVRVGI